MVLSRQNLPSTGTETAEGDTSSELLQAFEIRERPKCMDVLPWAEVPTAYPAPEILTLPVPRTAFILKPIILTDQLMYFHLQNKRKGGI